MLTEQTETFTRVEEIALQALLAHLGLLDTEDEEGVVVDKTRGRTWTKAQRAAQSRRMKAAWRARRSK